MWRIRLKKKSERESKWERVCELWAREIERERDRDRDRERERETVQTVAAAKRQSGYLMMKKLIAERKEREYDGQR